MLFLYCHHIVMCCVIMLLPCRDCNRDWVLLWTSSSARLTTRKTPNPSRNSSTAVRRSPVWAQLLRWVSWTPYGHCRPRFGLRLGNGSSPRCTRHSAVTGCSAGDTIEPKPVTGTCLLPVCVFKQSCASKLLLCVLQG